MATEPLCTQQKAIRHPLKTETKATHDLSSGCK